MHQEYNLPAPGTHWLYPFVLQWRKAQKEVPPVQPFIPVYDMPPVAGVTKYYKAWHDSRFESNFSCRVPGNDTTDKTEAVVLFLQSLSLGPALFDLLPNHLYFPRLDLSRCHFTFTGNDIKIKVFANVDEPFSRRVAGWAQFLGRLLVQLASHELRLPSRTYHLDFSRNQSAKSSWLRLTPSSTDESQPEARVQVAVPDSVWQLLNNQRAVAIIHQWADKLADSLPEALWEAIYDSSTLNFDLDLTDKIVLGPKPAQFHEPTHPHQAHASGVHPVGRVQSQAAIASHAQLYRSSLDPTKPPFVPTSPKPPRRFDPTRPPFVPAANPHAG